MKKIFVSLMIAAITFSACKKESSDTRSEVTEAKANLQGTWVGKWGNHFDTAIHDLRIELKSNNVIEINNSVEDFTGTWNVEEFTFVASCVLNDQTLTLRAPLSKSRLEGTWRNLSTGANRGTFFVTKQQ